MTLTGSMLSSRGAAARTLEWLKMSPPGAAPPPPGGAEYIVPSGGVSATPSTLSSVVSAQPEGALIILEDGTYPVSALAPKSGQRLWARNKFGAIIEGGNVRTFAFSHHDTANPRIGVELHGMVVRNYKTTITGHGALGNGGAVGWLYEDLEVYGNAHTGIGFAPFSVIRRVYTHDNAETGLSASYPRGSLIEDCVIEHNGYGGGFGWKDASGSAGGVKVVLGTGSEPVVFRRCISRDNFGPGFWIDFSPLPYVYEECEAYDNDGPGFFLEASRPGPILVDGCKVAGTKNWAGIYLAGSEMIEVRNCQVDGRGALVSEENTGDRRIRECYVHDNVFTNVVAGTQGAQSQSGFNIFDPNKLRFRNNSYPGISGNVFRWNSQTLTLAEWRALGQDV